MAPEASEAGATVPEADKTVNGEVTGASKGRRRPKAVQRPAAVKEGGEAGGSKKKVFTGVVTGASNGRRPPKAVKRPASVKEGGVAGGSKKKAMKMYNVVKRIHPEFGISARAMAIINSFLSDTFDKIASEASRLARDNDTPTIFTRDIETAVRLLLPDQLARHAMLVGTKAVNKFTGAVTLA